MKGAPGILIASVHAPINCCGLHRSLSLHQLAEHGLEISQGSLSGIARRAGVCGSGFAQEGQILFFQLLKFCRDTDIHRELLYGIDRSLAIGLLIHPACVDTKCLSDLLILLAGVVFIEFHDNGQHHSACHTVGCVIDRTESMSHGVSNSQADIGISHGSHVLSQSHALAPVRIIFNGGAQVLRDQLDSLKVKAVGQGPGSFGRVPFYRVSQGIHSGRSGQSLRHGGHHNIPDCSQ